MRVGWKTARDTARRGYTPEQVAAELQRREPESQRYIRPQQREADIVVSFGPIEGRADPPGTPAEESNMVAKAIWDGLEVPEPMPSALRLLEDGVRNEPVRLVQLILLYHLLRTSA